MFCLHLGETRTKLKGCDQENLLGWVSLRIGVNRFQLLSCFRFGKLDMKQNISFVNHHKTTESLLIDWVLPKHCFKVGNDGFLGASFVKMNRSFTHLVPRV